MIKFTFLGDLSDRFKPAFWRCNEGHEFSEEDIVSPDEFHEWWNAERDKDVYYDVQHMMPPKYCPICTKLG